MIRVVDKSDKNCQQRIKSAQPMTKLVNGSLRNIHTYIYNILIYRANVFANDSEKKGLLACSMSFSAYKSNHNKHFHFRGILILSLSLIRDPRYFTRLFTCSHLSTWSIIV